MAHEILGGATAEGRIPSDDMIRFNLYHKCVRERWGEETRRAQLKGRFEEERDPYGRVVRGSQGCFFHYPRDGEDTHNKKLEWCVVLLDWETAQKPG